MPSEFWCDEDGIWDCPDGSDETDCGNIGKPVISKAKNVRDIRREFHKNALKAARKQQKKARRPQKTLKMASNNPKYWHKLRKAKSVGKKR